MISASAQPAPQRGMARPANGPACGVGSAFTALASTGTGYHRVSATRPQASGLADDVGLRELRYFAAAARAGNLATAARDLNITAPAISQQLRKLEGALGTPLLIRHGRGVTPTQAGCPLAGADRCRGALAQRAAWAGGSSRRARRNHHTGIAGRAGSGAGGANSGHAAGASAAPDASDQGKCRRRRRFPGCWPARWTWLFCQIRRTWTSCDIDRLASENLGLVAAPNSGLACGTRSLRLHDLDRLPLILPGRRHWTRRLLARAAFQRGLRCEPAFEIDSLAVTKDMVRRGVGYAVLPVTAVRDEAARGALVFCPVEKPPLMAGYAIARASAAPAVLRDAGRTIRGAIQSLIAE